VLLHLAGVAREARLAADLRQLDIATAADVSHEMISRLERAQSWPKNPDRIIGAYEKECGLPEGELWRRAVGRL
jgi:transcriptional regulator with XRE-family HTH domain